MVNNDLEAKKEQDLLKMAKGDFKNVEIDIDKWINDYNWRCLANTAHGCSINERIDILCMLFISVNALIQRPNAQRYTREQLISIIKSSNYYPSRIEDMSHQELIDYFNKRIVYECEHIMKYIISSSVVLADKYKICEKMLDVLSQSQNRQCRLYCCGYMDDPNRFLNDPDERVRKVANIRKTFDEKWQTYTDEEKKFIIYLTYAIDKNLIGCIDGRVGSYTDGVMTAKFEGEYFKNNCSDWMRFDEDIFRNIKDKRILAGTLYQMSLENKLTFIEEIQPKRLNISANIITNENNQELQEEPKNIINFENYEDNEKCNERLMKYSKEIDDGTFKSEEVGSLLETLTIFPLLDNAKKVQEKLPKIRKEIATYYNCTEEEICMGDYKPKEEMTCPYKIILGNADFDGSKVTDLGNLQYIGGSAYFNWSEITSLGNLQYIGGSTYFSNSQVTDLGNLKSIGGNAHFYYFKGTDLGNLQNIGGDADFEGSKVTDLGNLQYIGGKANFKYSEITDLGNLQNIGGCANFGNSKVTDLGNLQSIGEHANFGNSKVTDLGNLQYIGRNADFRWSKVTDLGNLQNIGGDAEFRNSKVTGLGNLQNIGGDAYFSWSVVTNLGNIEHIGGEIITDENNAYLKEEYEQRIKGGKRI